MFKVNSERGIMVQASNPQEGRQAYPQFEDRLDYTVKPCLNKNYKKWKTGKP